MEEESDSELQYTEKNGERKRDKMKAFLSHKVDESDVQAGDHIYTWRACFIYAHHGIYAGQGKVVHFNSRTLKSRPKCSVCSGSGKGESGVIESCLQCFMQKGSLYRYKYGARKRVYFAQIRGGTCTTQISDDPATVIHRAMYLLNINGFGKYNLLQKNCEDFAIYCKTGKLVPPENGVGCSGQIGAKMGKCDIGFRKDVVEVEVENLAAFLDINNYGG
ncbi:hypothetical protein ACS0TY_015334 [Phlomoides rotata]